MSEEPPPQPMGEIPFFDSLAHPTLTGQWITAKHEAHFESLVADMKEAGCHKACAIGMAEVGGYAHEDFLRRCLEFDCLVPVAGIGPHRTGSILQEFTDLKALGYRAVKIHPRFLGISGQVSRALELFEAAAELDLSIFYCTYMHTSIEAYPREDPFYSLVDVLKQCPKARVVLVHGGDVNLLRYAELTRFNDNLLLDLSLTMMKYPGSSLDLDIAFLFHHFDRRICIGTDYPEYRPQELRHRFDFFRRELSTEKAQNIAFRNLEGFLSV